MSDRARRTTARSGRGRPRPSDQPGAAAPPATAAPSGAPHPDRAPRPGSSAPDHHDGDPAPRGGPVTAAALDLPEGLHGPELVQAVLDAARARRQNTPRPTRRTPAGTGRRPRGYSGAGPDPRDPQPFGAILARLVKTRGWQRPTAEALIFGDWPRMVGAEIAAHSRPVKLENGELTVEADSTAWATQLRLFTARLLAGISAGAGHNVVKKLHIHGPTAPSWSRGPRRVRGRGPRDTYG